MGTTSRLRYAWVSLMRGPAFMQRVKREAMTQLIGHARVIGWEGGLPVRSLTIPAEYSPALAKSTARLYNSLRSRLTYPGLASLSLTNACDCRCPHCFAFDQPGADLTTAAWVDVVKQSLDLGVFSFVINGGEPLLVRDLGEIVAAIDPDRASCLLYTNGSQLAQRAAELRAAGLRRVAIALDDVDPRRHDAHRAHPGLFEKAMAGFAAARRHGMLAGFSTFATPERLADGTLGRIFEFARRSGACEIILYDALPSGKLRDCASARKPAPEHRRRLRELVEAWWARDDAPGVWWYGHVSSYQNFGCSGGTAMFSVAHNGDFRPCDFCREQVGNVAAHRVEELWGRLSRSAVQRRQTVGAGCRLLE